MISKSLFRHTRQAARVAQQFRYFSAEDAPKVEFEPTPEEVAKGRETWGIEYNDECLKFEKEW